MLIQLDFSAQVQSYETRIVDFMTFEGNGARWMDNRLQSGVLYLLVV